MLKKTIGLLAISLILSNTSIALEEKTSTIHVETSASKQISPDTAKISFSVENYGINLIEVKEKNDKIISKAIGEIKNLLNNDESVKTTAYRVNNIYSYKDKIRIFQKYQVTNNFEVKLKDIDKVSKIIDVALANDIKTVNNINFYLEDSNLICTDLITEATKHAILRVNKIAQSANAQLDKINTLNSYCSTEGQTPKRYYMNTYKSAGVASESVDSSASTIEAGEINTTARVNLIYYLK